MNKTVTFGIFLIIIGTLMVLHHIYLWQRAFDIEDMLHHEFFEAIFFTTGITLLISAYHNSKERRGQT